MSNSAAAGESERRENRRGGGSGGHDGRAEGEVEAAFVRYRRRSTVGSFPSAEGARELELVAWLLGTKGHRPKWRRRGVV